MRTRVIQFTVTGRGKLPLDMLRRDRCYPATEADSACAENFSGERSIVLETTTDGYFAPTTHRWESFGWEVSDTTVMR